MIRCPVQNATDSYSHEKLVFDNSEVANGMRIYSIVGRRKRVSSRHSIHSTNPILTLIQLKVELFTE